MHLLYGVPITKQQWWHCNIAARSTLREVDVEQSRSVSSLVGQYIGK